MRKQEIWSVPSQMETGHRGKYYRNYVRCRNFAEFRCHRVPYMKDHCHVREFLKTVEARYSCNSTHFFFESSEDAIRFRLKFLG